MFDRTLNTSLTSQHNFWGLLYYCVAFIWFCYLQLFLNFSFLCCPCCPQLCSYFWESILLLICFPNGSAYIKGFCCCVFYLWYSFHQFIVVIGYLLIQSQYLLLSCSVAFKFLNCRLAFTPRMFVYNLFILLFLLYY